MTQINVVMPFTRNQNKNIILDLYKGTGVKVHLIMWDYDNWGEDWVVHLSSPSRKAEHGCYYKINRFIKKYPIQDEEYYWMMGDDDGFQEGLIEEISRMNDDVVFVSMKRGIQTPEGVPITQKHPPNNLLAYPPYIYPTMVGMEQMFIKGKIFRNVRLDQSNPVSDGLLAMKLKKECRVSYRPELFVYFNYHEPGRWN